MLPSVLPTETDHVPVLADEVVAALDPRPGETVVDCTFGAGGHSALLAERLQRRGQADRDRPRPDASRRTSSGSAARPACKARLLSRRVLDRARAARGERRAAPTSILLDLGVSSMQLDRPERGFSYAADAPLDMRMDPSAELLGARARQRGRASASSPTSSSATARSATRARSHARSSGAAQSSRSSARAISSR